MHFKASEERLSGDILESKAENTDYTKTSISDRHYDKNMRELNKKQENLSSKEPRTDRKPKRKVACLIGYCGTGYHGMQLNDPNLTIEREIFEALVNVGAISTMNADDPKKSSLNRAARTDRGVHAACNVISLKMIIDQPGLLEAINAALPKTIRMWGITRTLGSFNPKTFCDSRIYEYLVPSYVFLPPYPMSLLAQRIAKHRETINEENAAWIHGNEYTLYCKDSQNIWSTEEKENSVTLKKTSLSDEIIDIKLKEKSLEFIQPEKSKEKEEMRRIELEKKKKYRISAERLELVRNAFKIFEGSHNFHNFTIGKPFDNKSVYRVIRSFTVSDPKIIQEMEWISLKVHGQSFMLHQIRKMVALVILVVRCGTPLSFISETFKSTRYNIPKAPGLGLLLEKPIFTGYNKRAESMNREIIDPSLYEKEIEEFKQAYIYDKIFSEESKENIYNGFLIHIDSCATNDFDYLIFPSQLT
ncbi:hypothetical protein PORY_000697 [Pneumocystis oryctolagi]|uniref:Uncharacterized protein n=1 Tax=Pneumocystis oryctolagi TaxID=42067 RepID=A0ACB7CGM0_9ASCO|nr:hypothetical protein PORY_000697 [Pneumocystis oryctolagi]